MSDLISRSALYDKLIYDTTKTVTVTGGEYIATWRIADVIEEAPAVDAVPVDKIFFTDLYLANGEAIATFKFGNQGITLRKKCEDFAPVVHGRWVYIGGDEWCCSVCGNVESTEGRWEPIMDKFCCECGAKMDGEADV